MMSVKFIWSNTDIFSLIFFLDHQSIDVSEVLKYAIFLPFYCLFLYLGLLIFLLYLGALILELLHWLHTYLQNVNPLANFFVTRQCSCVFLYNHCFKVYFIWYKYSHLSYILVSICIKYLFPSIHFQHVCSFTVQADTVINIK